LLSATRERETPVRGWACDDSFYRHAVSAELSSSGAICLRRRPLRHLTSQIRTALPTE
jgi:hypothetical protein